MRTEDMSPGPDETPLSPEEMLGLLDDQRRSVEGQMGAFVPVIVTTWGIAWLVGFGALWLIDGLEPAFSLPLGVAVTVFVAVIAGAIAVSTVFGIRSGRGIRGNTGDSFTGTVYGLTWLIGGLGIVGFAQGLLYNGMDRELASIFYPVAFVLFAGIMYIISGAIWRTVPPLILGVWTTGVAVAAPFFGYPTHYLVLALAGGTGFLVLGILLFARLARLRRRVARRVAGSRPDGGEAVRRG